MKNSNGNSHEAAGNARLNAEAQLGFWVTLDEQHGFVVFEEDGRKRAFLLSNFRGRPAYSCIDLDWLDIPAKFDGAVALASSCLAAFEIVGATLGKLVIRDGTAFLTTIDALGAPAEVQIAPFLRSTSDEDGEHEWAWRLLREGAQLHADEMEDDVIYRASSRQSWLNWWTSPYDDGEEDEDEDEYVRGDAGLN